MGRTTLSGLTTLPRLSLAACAVALLPLAGCLDYGEELVLNADGSGKLTIDFTIDMSYMEEVTKVLGDTPDPEELRGPTKEEVMEAVAEAEGITVEEVDVKTRDKQSRVHLKLAFVSLEALSRLEGFGDERKLEFYDEGDGKVRVMYSFDTTDVVPVDEVAPGEAPQGEVDPVEKKIMEITQRARDSLRFKARMVLPGPILNSNGARDPATPNGSLWKVDKQSDPERHAKLGKGRVKMMVLVDRKTVGFVKELLPKPQPQKPEGETPAPGGEKKPGLGE